MVLMCVLLKRPATDVVHDEVAQVVAHPCVVHGHDVGMPQFCQNSELTVEPDLISGSGEPAPAKNLNCNKLARGFPPALVDDSLPSTVNLRDDLVAWNQVIGNGR